MLQIDVEIVDEYVRRKYLAEQKHQEEEEEQNQSERSLDPSLSVDKISNEEYHKKVDEIDGL